MAHIAVVGKPSRLRFQVTSQINTQLGSHTTIHTHMSEIYSLLSSGSMALVVIVDESLNDLNLEKLDEFHSRFEKARVVFVGKGITPDMREQFCAMKLDRCTIVDAGLELQDLQPIMRKMSLGQKVFVRKHFRHRMSQDCRMNTATSKQNTTVRVLDISQGGLRAVYRQLELKQGEVVHILVATDDGKRQHRIIGKVAWMNAARREFGVAFDKVSVENSLKFTNFGSGA